MPSAPSRRPRACAAERQPQLAALRLLLLLLCTRLARAAKAHWPGTRGGPIVNATSDCWDTCRGSGFFCPVFCCQPPDRIGNPTCWDINGYYTYPRCCHDPAVQAVVAPAEQPDSEPPFEIAIGSLRLPLYRGPSHHNSPMFNERTLEVALGLWFLRRRIAAIWKAGVGEVPLEIGNVLARYWPEEERLFTKVLPWQVYDLLDTGQDATYATFHGASVLSISTIEHIGYDNEGMDRAEGVRISVKDGSWDAWVRSWDAGPALLKRIMREAAEYLVTFPVGFNPHLDAVVSQTPGMAKFARVARRVDARNRWEVDPVGSFEYGYDFRDTYSVNHVGYIYDPRLSEVYLRIYNTTFLAPPPLPVHPPFRFANAICIVTNLEELLA